MKKLFAIILSGVFLLCSSSAFAKPRRPKPTPTPTPTPVQTPAPITWPVPAGFQWPYIYGQSGTYGVNLSTNTDIAEMASHGMKLHIGSINSVNRFAIEQAGARVIEYKALINQFCPSGYGSCAYSSTTEQNLLNQFQQYLESIRNDPYIVGFWILDDYPGIGLPGFLEKMHALVATANLTSVVKRSTFCGFMADLDYVWTTTPPYHRFQQAGSGYENFTTTGCDFIVPYIYAYKFYPTDTAASFDWSMSALLPDLLNWLKTLGWDPAKNPLVGMPGTFSDQGGIYYVPPRQQDAAAQIAGFCKNGAVAILPYIWNQGQWGGQTPSNDPAMKQGVFDGLEICRKQYWGQ